MNYARISCLLIKQLQCCPSVIGLSEAAVSSKKHCSCTHMYYKCMVIQAQKKCGVSPRQQESPFDSLVLMMWHFVRQIVPCKSLCNFLVGCKPLYMLFIHCEKCITWTHFQEVISKKLWQPRSCQLVQSVTAWQRFKKQKSNCIYWFIDNLRMHL